MSLPSLQPVWVWTFLSFPSPSVHHVDCFSVGLQLSPMHVVNCLTLNSLAPLEGDFMCSFSYWVQSLLFYSTLMSATDYMHYPVPRSLLAPLCQHLISALKFPLLLAMVISCSISSVISIQVHSGCAFMYALGKQFWKHDGFLPLHGGDLAVEVFMFSNDVTALLDDRAYFKSAQVVIHVTASVDSHVTELVLQLYVNKVHIFAYVHCTGTQTPFPSSFKTMLPCHLCQRANIICLCLYLLS